MFKKLIVLPILALLAVGCNLKEDLSDCGVLRLSLRFTYNTEQIDRLEANVNDVHFYVFDKETDILVDIIEVGYEEITRGYTEVEDLPAGTYTFVAWGCGDEDMLGDGHFIEAHMNDSPAHDHTRAAIIGETTLDDFYMMVDYDVLPDDVLGDIAPKVDDFHDLFFANVTDVVVKNEENQTVDFDFIRNTNVLKVNITGLEHLEADNATRAPAPGQPLDVFAIGKNGRYRWNNAICQDARTVRYEPPYTSLDDDSMQVDIKTLRLDLARHSEIDPIVLHVENPADGKPLISPLSVMDAIVQVKDDEGNFLYRTQEDIDREYEFPIDISIQPDKSVRIFISDWEIINLTPVK